MLRPFSRFCVRIGAIPRSIIESLSYEEQLIRLIKFIKDTIIPAVDGNADAIEELQSQMVNLQNYVNTYFDNLDVQSEINNKLDEMAESGQLQEIIAQYLNSKAVFGFNTVADMKESENLQNGSYAKTLGFYAVNDGGGATYKIRTRQESDIENGFVLLLNNELAADLCVENSILNVRQFGAKGDNSTDITNILNNMISSSYLSIYFPMGQYRVEGTVNFKSSMKIFGDFNGCNINIYPDAQFVIGTDNALTTNVRIENLTIRVNGTRDKFAIDFINACYCRMFKCLIRSDNGDSKYNGVAFRLTNSSLHCYDNTISENQYQRAALTFDGSTDNFIVNNMLWGNSLMGTAALTLKGACHNTLIEGNHYAVGELGALRISDTCNQLRIVNNYFDAQGIGINANQLSECTISDNIFYRPEKAIEIVNLNMSSVSNNLFRDCDVNNAGNPDIKITTTQGGNTFVGNKHYRTSSVTHTNKAVAMDIPNGSANYPLSVINMASVWFTTYYNRIDPSLQDRNKYVNCYPASLF